MDNGRSWYCNHRRHSSCEGDSRCSHRRLRPCECTCHNRPRVRVTKLPSDAVEQLLEDLELERTRSRAGQLYTVDKAP